MIDMLSKLGSWNWLIIGVVLMGIETFAPGVFMLWLGLAAIIVGILSFGLAWSWQAQIIIFAALSISMVPLWRHFAQRNAKPSDQPFLNKRAESLVGREFTLENAIVNGAGTIKIDDTVWRITGADAPSGARVKILAADGASLKVG